MTRARGLPWPRLVFRRSSDPAPDKGDEHARLNELIMPHLNAAYGFARYLSRDEAGAEDIMQEAFLRAMRAIGQCHGNSKAWLLAIVRNCYHDWARANGRYVAVETLPDCEDEAAAPHEALERAAEITGVRQLVENLPEPFRATLVLRELEELSYREIAEIMSVPIGTVMSRLARARQMLAGLVLDEEQGNKGAIAQ